MPITAPPTIPQITDPSTFATRAQDWVAWQANQLYPALIEESLLLGLSLSGTSVTSNSIGTGSKSFTTQTGLGFKAGQSLSIARTSSPTNRMFVVVDSYDSVTGALVVTSQAFEGSGTFTDWSINVAYNGVIATGQIADLAVTALKLAADAVTTAKILDANVTAAKLATSAKPNKLFDIGATVASNALTITINPFTADFRSGTLTNGTPNSRTLVAATSCVVPSGATLGTLNATGARLAILAIDNAGTIEVAVCNLAGAINLNEMGVISTTALSATATSADVIYSTTARTNVAYRVVGYINITQATAGTWATAPSAQIPLSPLNSVIAALNVTGNAPMYACRAWVNFNGTGTVAIRGSGNVSSITDNGTGLYTVNFITAMPDTSYAITSAGANISTDGRRVTLLAISMGSFQIFTENNAGSSADTTWGFAAVFR